MSTPTIVLMYNLTPYMAQPWLDAGYNVILNDTQHIAAWHYNGPVTTSNLPAHLFVPRIKDQHDRGILNIVGVFGFPPCTDTAVSGATHFAAKRRKNPNFQIEALELAHLVADLGEYVGCWWALENPVSVYSTLWRKPDYTFHPSDYGGYLTEEEKNHPQYPTYIPAYDAYPKKTCIWCGNGFIMPPKKPVERPDGYSPQHKKLGGKSIKTKNIRSATPRGFAKAVYEYNSFQGTGSALVDVRKFLTQQEKTYD